MVKMKKTIFQKSKKTKQNRWLERHLSPSTMLLTCPVLLIYSLYTYFRYNLHRNNFPDLYPSLGDGTKFSCPLPQPQGQSIRNYTKHFLLYIYTSVSL